MAAYRFVFVMANIEMGWFYMRMSGNPWILNKTMNEDAIGEIEDSALKKCAICKSDELRDYNKYKSSNNTLSPHFHFHLKHF